MVLISLVTGASSGLGRVLAELLCEKGHRVYVIARRKNLLEELKKQCKNLEGEVIIIPGDLSDGNFRKKLISQILKKEKKIDYLFNNAGFGRAILFEKQNKKEIENMFKVNVIAYEHLAALVLSSMKKSNNGRIINIGSVVAFTPLPYFTAYNSTKSAVYGFNRSLIYELKGLKVTSTVVLPARMKTGFAEKAYDCYKEKGRNMCIEKFNKIAESPYVVAKNIIKNMNKGKEIITPTLRAKMWYSTRYFGFVVDFVMKYILGPKERKHLEQAVLKEDYKNS
ncbi:SDR family NAD(P)-dependent oxidoreductase [Candidatus Pacearchaeota archaeon]|nr:SDR family NAD(P)-dependent oxidoreductase [Candidatus Pacearchaeota archaeon]